MRQVLNNMEKVKRYSTLLQALAEADPKTQVGIVRSAPHDFILTLVEIVFNLLKGQLSVPSKVIRDLKPRATQLRRLSMCRGKRGMQRARKTLSQRGGLLFLAPIIAAAVLASQAPKIAANAASNATDAALDRVGARIKKTLKL